jgi:hypothetical protein
MRFVLISQTARFLRAVFFLGGLLGAASIVAHAAGVPAASVPTTAAQTQAKPLWSDLTPAQQQALAPLAEEWDKLEAFRKNKWLAIGNKFGSMKQDEQQRMQERMRDWVALTPEQRRAARENYVRAKKLQPDQKSAQWEQYQQLPEEQKKKLAEDARSKKQVTTLPPPKQHKDSKTVPPIKSSPKPVLEQSVTSQAATQSALQPIASPNTK